MELTRLRLGRTEFTAIYIKKRNRHIVVLGKSGTGKSSIILVFWFQDCMFPYAKIMIDPSGELAKQAYALTKGKALYCSLKTPIPINLMDSDYEKFQIAESLREALNHMITQTSDQNKELTVKMCGIFDRAVMYCLDHQLKSLVNVKDYIVNSQEKGISEARDGLIQRLNFLLNDERMLPILCGSSGIRLKDVISKRQSFILDCKGMGKEKMIFCGALLSQMIKNYMRYDEPTNPCVVYIDECHNFIGSGFLDTALREGRKYNLSILLSTQGFSGVPQDLRQVMLSVGNLICFQVPSMEANYVARELNTTPQTLQFIEKWHAAYMTPEERGIVKVSRPPVVPNMEIKAEPKKTPSEWFSLESYQPPDPQ